MIGGSADADAQVDRLRAALRELARECVEALGAGGCVVSRVVGELLVEIVEHTPDGRSLQLGHGYLVSDYPLTREVLEQREPRRVSLLEPDPDPAEARLLRQLGFDSLLILPLETRNELWAIVEVYRNGVEFDDAEQDKATAIVERFARALEGSAA